MHSVSEGFVETNGIRMRYVAQGTGPAVLLCHGFPELSYSWRHQMGALAEAGFRAVAPDLRGYGGTDAPEDPAAYTQLHLVGDLVGLLDALAIESAVIVGHDWGASLAWNAALLRADRFRAVAAMSVPFYPRTKTRPTVGLRQAAGEQSLYMLHFQEPGIAERELTRDVRDTLRKVYFGASGDAPPALRWQPIRPRGAGFLEGLVDPPRLPAWITESDVDHYAAEFTRTGFTGALNWYRCMDRTWELMAPFHGAKVRVPALFLAGDCDPTLGLAASTLQRMPETVPTLRESIMLTGAGHWVQQERPAEVNAALLAFLRALPA